jgi:hypothetical protein
MGSNGTARRGVWHLGGIQRLAGERLAGLDPGAASHRAGIEGLAADRATGGLYTAANMTRAVRRISCQTRIVGCPQRPRPRVPRTCGDEPLFELIELANSARSTFSAGMSACSLALWNPPPDDGGDGGIVALAAAT